MPEDKIENGKETLQGENSQPGSLVDRAEAAALRIEAANKRTEELYKLNQETEARIRLGGNTGASPAINEGDQKKQAALEMFKGTGIEDAIKKYG